MGPAAVWPRTGPGAIQRLVYVRLDSPNDFRLAAAAATIYTSGRRARPRPALPDVTLARALVDEAVSSLREFIIRSPGALLPGP
jgi:hypothetical protein